MANLRTEGLRTTNFLRGLLGVKIPIFANLKILLRKTNKMAGSKVCTPSEGTQGAA